MSNNVSSFLSVEEGFDTNNDSIKQLINETNEQNDKIIINYK